MTREVPQDHEAERWLLASLASLASPGRESEAKALEAFLLELPFNGRALPAHLFQQKTPARTGA